jgi:hypothetical protein
MKKYTHKHQYASSHSYRDALRKRRRAEENKAFIRAEKERRGCEITGLPFPPEELEFHHTGSKHFPVGRANQKGRQKLSREVAACQCLHRDLHHALHAVERRFLELQRKKKDN